MTKFWIRSQSATSSKLYKSYLLFFITSIVPQNIDQAVGTLQGNINDIFFDATVSGTIESNNDRVLMKISFANVPREFQALSSLLTPMYLSVANKLEILQSSNGEFQHYTVVSFFLVISYFLIYSKDD